MPILTERRSFGRTGLSVSPVGFGGAPIGFLETERAQATRLLNTLLDEGVNLLDTAAMYRGSEEMIGSAVGHRRDEFVLVSKCGHPIEGVDAPAWSSALIRASIDRTLARLGTDRVEVMLLHSCDRATLERGEALGAVLDAVKAGKVRFAGYSGDNDALTAACAMDGIDVVQTSVNICDQSNIDAGVRTALQANIGVMAKRPIANAAWKKLDDQPGTYRGYASEYTRRFGRMGVRIEELHRADAHGDESAWDGGGWPEVALRFTLTVPGVSTAIIGTTNPDNACANLRVAAKGPLPTAVYDLIRAAFRAAADTDTDHDWSGQT